MTNPTGRSETRDGVVFLVFERSFRASVDDVWAAVTEPGRLERWIGTWAGDPATGSVTFRMTAEGDDVPAEQVVIQECTPPTRLRLLSARPDDPTAQWTWEIDLREDGGTTTLTFAQQAVDAELAESVGPGWDYYLDRLVASRSAGPAGAAAVAAVDFDDYYPAHAAHYRAEVDRLAM